MTHFTAIRAVKGLLYALARASAGMSFIHTSGEDTKDLLDDEISNPEKLTIGLILFLSLIIGCLAYWVELAEKQNAHGPVRDNDTRDNIVMYGKAGLFALARMTAFYSVLSYLKDAIMTLDERGLYILALMVGLVTGTVALCLSLLERPVQYSAVMTANSHVRDAEELSSLVVDEEQQQKGYQAFEITRQNQKHSNLTEWIQPYLTRGFNGEDVKTLIKNSAVVSTRSQPLPEIPQLQSVERHKRSRSF